MTNKSLFLINKMLKENGQHKLLKFAIFRSKCLDILEKELKYLEEGRSKIIQSEEFKEYIEKEKALYVKYGTQNEDGSINVSEENTEQFVNELKELQSQYEVVNEFKKVDEEFKKILEETTNIVLPTISMNDLPTDITGNDYELIKELVTE